MTFDHRSFKGPASWDGPTMDKPGAVRSPDISAVGPARTSTITPHMVVQLQRLAGNRATLSVLRAGDTVECRRSSADPSRVVVQRTVSLDDKDSTEKNQYYTAAGGGNDLFAAQEARPPAPRELYESAEDVSDDGTPLTVWTPRARLVHASNPREAAEQKEEKTGKAIGPEEMQEINDSFVRPLVDEVQELVDQGADHGERIGAVGWNDCAGWARTLQILIQKYRDEPGKDSLVGQTWQHRTDQKKADFPYHYSTVVAQDGVHAVTLEAHAGQKGRRGPPVVATGRSW